MPGLHQRNFAGGFEILESWILQLSRYGYYCRLQYQETCINMKHYSIYDRDIIHSDGLHDVISFTGMTDIRTIRTDQLELENVTDD